ncbi:MAG: hypothetical protein M3Q75_09360 [Gemmatimonadota bacterium]|nr:hypothetical protein [Gemmatimonadota bacterium]
MPNHQPLLGRLAATWFNEVIATDALRLLLDDTTLRTALLKMIMQATGVDLSGVTAFERERRTQDGRLDLEGVDRQGRPRLIVEVKFGHLIGFEQVNRYRTHQGAELGDDLDGVLLLLVPPSRLREAQGVMDFARANEEPGLGRSGRIRLLALSWDSVLDELSAVVGDGSGPVSIAADIGQLRAVCDTLSVWSTPLAAVSEIEREGFLRVVVDQLKERVPAVSLRSLQVRDPDYLVFRYYEVPELSGTVFSIGVVPGSPTARRGGVLAPIPPEDRWLLGGEEAAPSIRRRRADPGTPWTHMVSAGC